MRTNANTTGALRHWLLTICLALACGAALHADEAKGELTPEQRKLKKQANALTAKGVEHFYRGAFAEAIPVLKEALAILQQVYPKDQYPDGHADLASGLDNLGTVLNNRNAFAEARPYCEQALAMRERLFPKAKYPDGHLALANSLNSLGTLLYAQGAYAEARPYMERALAMSERLFPREKYPDGHDALAMCLHNLASLLKAQGAYGEARPLFERALAMAERLYPKDKYPDGHANLADCMNSLGFVLAAQGAFGEARLHYERALAMTERLYPKAQYPNGHSHLAIGLNNLGTLLKQQGAHAEARPLFERALAMTEQLYPANKYPNGHSDLAMCLTNLGAELREQAAYDEARTYLERALAMTERLYPKAQYPNGHSHLAIGLNNLGTLLNAQGAYREARPYYERALAMRERLFPPERYPDGHPELAISLTSLGVVLNAQGEFGEARSCFEKATAMTERLYPKVSYQLGHPEIASNLGNLGAALLARDACAEARPHLERALAMYQGLSESFATTAAESDVLNRLVELPFTLDAYLSVTRRLNEGPDAYAAVFRGKAAIARVLERRREALLLTSDPKHRDLGRQLADTRRELAALVLAPAGSRPGLAARVQERTKDKEDLERKLARALLAFAALKERDQLGAEDLRAKLPPRTVFVDLHQYRYIEHDKNKPGADGVKHTASYVAFVLTADKSARRVELGPAEAIEQAATAWRRAIVAVKGELDDRETPAATLRRLVWAPLAKEIPADTEAVYLAPDGALTQLPWAALPGSKPGTVLLEDYALAVVPHGRYLLERLLDQPATNADKGLLLAVGGVGYGDAPAPLTEVAAAEKLRAAETGGRAITWKDLPGTAREVERVLALAGKRDARPRRGAEASTERLVRELPEARWVHLATHGFFADASVRSALRLSEEDYKRSRRGERVGAGARNPLVLSGLVLAGANRTGEAAAADRGILTAEAVAGMFLDKMDLAVLSACETGLGEVAGGEGVFGLQRAFHIAGAKNVVASLWKVDDNATAALMGLFYRKLWQEKLPPIEALRQAQLAIYRSSPEEITDLATRSWDVSQPVKVPDGGPAAGKRGRAPVKQWAGFVLSGAGR